VLTGVQVLISSVTQKITFLLKMFTKFIFEKLRLCDWGCL